MNLYYAGFSRAIGDWLLGMNATRLYTVKHGGYKQVLIIGRVCANTYAHDGCGSLEEIIENFKPQTVLGITTLYRETLLVMKTAVF
jgi:DNA topoisomerase-3